MTAFKFTAYIFSVLCLIAPAYSLQDESASQQAYNRARRQLEEKHYEKALQGFEGVAQAGDYRPDGALYWKAYAQSRLGQSAEAMETLAAFYAGYPESRWASEARLLEAEIRQSSGNPVEAASDSDEEMKLAIVSSLANSRSEQVLPMLEKILQGSYSLKLKDRALFALSQQRSPRAAEIITAIAKGESQPDLQMKAIRYLGLFAGEKNRQLLGEIYDSSDDLRIKKVIIHSWVLKDSKERLLQIARQEQNTELRAAAVQQLGAVGARQELAQLYAQEQDVEVRQRILNSLAVSGAVEELSRVAREESNPQLRRAAVSKLGLLPRDKVAPILDEIYRGSSDPEVKRAVMMAYFIQRNDQALIEIARSEPDLELRKSAVRNLSVMGTPAATEFLLELLDK